MIMELIIQLMFVALSSGLLAAALFVAYRMWLDGREPSEADRQRAGEQIRKLVEFRRDLR